MKYILYFLVALYITIIVQNKNNSKKEELNIIQKEKTKLISVIKNNNSLRLNYEKIIFDLKNIINKLKDKIDLSKNENLEKISVIKIFTNKIQSLNLKISNYSDSDNKLLKNIFIIKNNLEMEYKNLNKYLYKLMVKDFYLKNINNKIDNIFKNIEYYKTLISDKTYNNVLEEIRHQIGHNKTMEMEYIKNRQNINELIKNLSIEVDITLSKIIKFKDEYLMLLSKLDEKYFFFKFINKELLSELDKKSSLNKVIKVENQKINNIEIYKDQNSMDIEYNNIRIIYIYIYIYIY